MPPKPDMWHYSASDPDVQEVVKNYNHEKTECILTLLTEYTEKLREGHDELRRQRQSLFTVLAAGLVILLATFIGASYTNTLGRFHILLAVGLYCFIMLSFVLYMRLEMKQIHDRLYAIVKRLEPLLRWTVQIHEHAERDEIRRLELNLRLKEAETYIQRIERKERKDFPE